MSEEMKEKLALGFGLIVMILCAVSMFMLAGCAGPQRYHYVKVGPVKGDVWVKNIGTRAQMEGGTNEIGVGIPVEGVPLKVDAKGDAPMQGTVIIISEVGGSLYFEDAFGGTQNVPIPEAIEALYKYGDPFEVK